MMHDFQPLREKLNHLRVLEMKDAVGRVLEKRKNVGGEVLFISLQAEPGQVRSVLERLSLKVGRGSSTNQTRKEEKLVTGALLLWPHHAAFWTLASLTGDGTHAPIRSAKFLATKSPRKTHGGGGGHY